MIQASTILSLSLSLSLFHDRIEFCRQQFSPFFYKSQKGHGTSLAMVYLQKQRDPFGGHPVTSELDVDEKRR
jgi:hypothetical protein